jgi:hypothetical protein
MSLHKFAEQVAANGRGDDSLLVHMTPDEVRNLQKFAEANGTTLTINPDTGLPEAGLLSDLFKAVAPIALGAFLGPGAFGIAGMGLSAGTAGLITGGLTTLATGSLSRGLMAGLGAYGGAGLAEGLAGTGAGVLGQQASEATAMELANAGAGEGLTGEAYNKAFQQSVTDKMAGANTFSAGLNAAKADPLGFAKNNLTNIGMAAAPIMAGAMVPTTTKLPEARDSGLIRQMAFNINPDTGKPDPLYGMREMTPVKASEFGNKTFQGQRDLFYQQNQNPYELGVGSLNQSPQQQAARMNTGGIVALAAGGPPTVQSDTELFAQTGDWNKAAAIRDEQNNALNAYNWQQQAEARDQAARASNITADADRLKAATNTNIAAPVDYNALATNYVTAAAANPNITTSDFITGANTANIGLTQPLATALDKSGLSAASQYALTHADIGDAGNVEETYGGLKGLSSNINYTLGAYNADAANKGKTGLQKQADALAAMNKYGINEADIKRATGKTLAELFPNTLTKPTSVIPTNYYGNDTGNVLTTTPGDITTNPDGTVTVHPNIPGRPDGGFTGMGQVRDTYTAGGGSLGYTAPVPKTAAEHNAMYNKLTDDSLDAYNFLMGKGKNLTQRKAETRDRPVMQRYDEAVLGRKIPKLTKPGTTTTKTDTKETVAGDTAVVSGVTFDLTDPTQAPAEDNNGPWSWDVVNKRWVQYGRFADGGMTGYAMGGGLGSLGSYSDGGRLLKGPGDGVSDSIPATIGAKNQPARLADGEFVIPARIVSELGNGSTDAGAKKLYAMMDRVQRARGKTTGKNKVAANSRADKYLPA